jgi:hypothetical protein
MLRSPTMNIGGCFDQTATGRRRRASRRAAPPPPARPAAAAFDGAGVPRSDRACSTARWHGVVAESKGRLAGFAIMTPQHIAATHFLASFFPPRGASLGYAAHATAPGMEHDAYRAMFGALAEHFVALGIFEMAVQIPAADETREAFASRSFGRTMTCAIRDVGPTARRRGSRYRAAPGVGRGRGEDHLRSTKN